MVGCSALMMTRSRVLVRTTRPRDRYHACGVVAQHEDGVISKAAGTRRTQWTSAPWAPKVGARLQRRLDRPGPPGSPRRYSGPSPPGRWRRVGWNDATVGVLWPLQLSGRAPARARHGHPLAAGRRVPAAVLPPATCAYAVRRFGPAAYSS